MAKTGGNFERCNVGSVEAHNERTPEYLKSVQESGRNLYFFQDLTKNNSSYVNPTYEGKTCSQIFQDLVQLYKSKIGQMPQLKDKEWIDKKTGKKKKRPGWSPIREAVIPIKADTTLEDFDKLIAWLREKGVEVIRLDLHKDEGYENVTGKRKMNYHAHLIVDWIDHKTANTAKLTPADMTDFQTMCAVSLDMERGTPKTVTGKEHLNSAEYREKAAEQHLAELTGIGAKVGAFFGVGELAEIRKELKEAKEERDVAVKDKKAALKALQYNIKAHGDELATEKEKSRQRGISEAVAAVKKAADLHITGKDGKETAEDIGKNWRWNFDQRKQLQSKVDSLTAEKKQLQSNNPFEQLNKVLQHFHISTLNTEDVEKAAAVIDRSYLGGWNAPARNDFCDAVIAWGRQKRELSNNPSPKALQILRKLFEAMVEAWNYLMRVVRKPLNKGPLRPDQSFELLRYDFTPEGVMKEVQLQLELTPGAAECSNGWQEALKQTPDQFLAPYHSLVKLHSDIEQEQHDQEQHIEEEEEVKRTWGAKR